MLTYIWTADFNLQDVLAERDQVGGKIVDRPIVTPRPGRADTHHTVRLKHVRNVRMARRESLNTDIIKDLRQVLPIKVGGRTPELSEASLSDLVHAGTGIN